MPETPAPAQTAERTGLPANQPVIINSSGANSSTPAGDGRVAALNNSATASDAQGSGSPQATGSVAGSSKLRWPVEGKVISAFGPRPDGTHNDGVNLAVPMGADVHAAEAGVVAYAGSELKGYGNLVLLRHDNGWVTAYAHGDELMVKRGDKVKRGQVIAKAGRTGQVDQPQVHFELRQGQRPVDPTPFMDRM
jgi:murein DD-endopeptidase MepM/ murein hydrolase activator NlpD